MFSVFLLQYSLLPPVQCTYATRAKTSFVPPALPITGARQGFHFSPSNQEQGFLSPPKKSAKCSESGGHWSRDQCQSPADTGHVTTGHVYQLQTPPKSCILHLLEQNAASLHLLYNTNAPDLAHTSPRAVSAGSGSAVKCTHTLPREAHLAAAVRSGPPNHPKGCAALSLKVACGFSHVRRFSIGARGRGRVARASGQTATTRASATTRANTVTAPHKSTASAFCARRPLRSDSPLSNANRCRPARATKPPSISGSGHVLPGQRSTAIAVGYGFGLL